MGRFVWTLLAGFAFGTPAVPVGLSLSLPGPVALFAVLLGAACCVVFAVVAMERARWHWQSWRGRRKSGEMPATDARLSGATGRRARRVLDRYGVVGFGLVGPALFGTWGSALLGAALGIPRWRLIGWLMTGIALWCTVMLVASDAAFAVFRIG
ncbi:small multi-drug export protein [Nocardia sp. XZ_19_385]|uniref:small multi-drug export protein n=1 Tax=Nocardia sp. XZ_19_385 TaxID=2769488 RepID=UPI00188FB7AC|nr:small multi-drug export protein [Nocardia sp. XZ_19_385]